MHTLLSDDCQMVYDTMVTADGANLPRDSGSFWRSQRAAVADPPVLILDEATSPLLIHRTEELIEKAWIS